MSGTMKGHHTCWRCNGIGTVEDDCGSMVECEDCWGWGEVEDDEPTLCQSCEQVFDPKATGEYPCKACGMPMTHDQGRADQLNASADGLRRLGVAVAVFGAMEAARRLGRKEVEDGFLRR